MTQSRTVIWGIFLGALILRLAYLLQSLHTPLLDFLYIDSEYYHTWAASIAGGDLAGGPQAFTMAPFYAYFLALIYAAAGVHVLPALVVQVLVGSLSCVLVHRVACLYFDQRTALIAGVVAAVYPVFIFYDAVLLKENLMVFFLLLFVLAYADGRPAALFAAGLFLGVNALMRPTIFLALPVLAVYEYVRARPQFITKSILLAAGILVTVFPVALRNRVVGGEWVITVASGGMNFWTGNNPSAHGAYVGAPFITSEEPVYEREDFRAEASRRAGRQLTIKESSDFWYREGWTFITEHPGASLRLLYRKFLAFWHTIELPSDINFYMARDYAPILSAIPLTFGIIAPLAVLGIVLYRGRSPVHVLLLCLAGTNLLASLIFFNSSRYRLPVVPIFIIYAAFFVTYYLRLWADRSPRRFWLAAAAVPLFVFMNYRDPLLAGIAGTRVSYLNASSYYMKMQQYPQAEQMLMKCLEIDPDYARAHEQYARLKALTGDTAAAGAYRARAVQIAAASGNPRDIKPMDDMQRAGVLYARKDYAGALALFQQLLEKNPSQAKELENNIGLCYVKLDDYASAERYYRSAVERDAGYDKAHYNLGVLYEKTGDTARARACFERALAANPANDKARQRLTP